tara:strand:- start:357 stop:485 length:129 start_codon:yes stop_codon:yes gene_type:complete
MKTMRYVKAALLSASAGAAAIVLTLGTTSAGEFDGVTLRVGT